MCTISDGRGSELKEGVVGFFLDAFRRLSRQRGLAATEVGTQAARKNKRENRSRVEVVRTLTRRSAPFEPTPGAPSECSRSGIFAQLFPQPFLKTHSTFRANPTKAQ